MFQFLRMETSQRTKEKLLEQTKNQQQTQPTFDARFLWLDSYKITS